MSNGIKFIVGVGWNFTVIYGTYLFIFKLVYTDDDEFLELYGILKHKISSFLFLTMILHHIIYQPLTVKMFCVLKYILFNPQS